MSMEGLLCIDSEFAELLRICSERGITGEQFLEEKLAPFQEKLVRCNGELVAATTRCYYSVGCGARESYLRTTHHVGIIKSETRLNDTGNPSFHNFLNGVERPHYFGGSSSSIPEKAFIAGGFFDNSIDPLLYFMERPPEPREIRHDSGGCFPYTKSLRAEKPRLELYIGNEETLPFLQGKLKGWEYVELARLLQHDLPLTEAIVKKIEKEQLDVFEDLRRNEKRLSALKTERDERLGLIRENLSTTKKLVETAIARGYHENGKTLEVKLDEGVVMHVNIKEFFARKKEQYEL